MKTLIGAILFTASSIVFAHSCPVLMKDIDARMGTVQGVSSEKMTKIKQLRADGERLHKQGKHDDSMKALQEAQSLLGT